MKKQNVLMFLFLVVLPIFISKAQFCVAEGNSSPISILKTAGKKISRSSSYTIKMTQSTKKNVKNKKLNRSVHQEITGTAKYERPYLYMDQSIKIKGNQSRTINSKMLGRIDVDKDEVTIFMKNMMTQNEWKNMEEVPVFKGLPNTILKLQKKLSNPKKRLKNIKSAGSETIDGQDCWKVTAELKEKVVKENADSMLKGPMKKLVSDMKINIPSSSVTYWINRDTGRMVKLKSKIKQDVTMTISMGEKKQTVRSKQTTRNTHLVKKYEKTSIPEKYKKKFQELQNKSKQD